MRFITPKKKNLDITKLSYLNETKSVVGFDRAEAILSKLDGDIFAWLNNLLLNSYSNLNNTEGKEEEKNRTKVWDWL